MIYMTFQRLSFYLHRLKKSSVAEIVYRFAEYVLINRLKVNPNLYKKDLTFSLNETANNSLLFPQIISLVKNETTTFFLDGKTYSLGEDSDSIIEFAKRWKDRFFSLVKFEKSDPDIRAVWESARLQHLMYLIQHLSVDCEINKRKNIQNYVHGRLFDWLVQNPFCYGPQYISVMECGLRLPVFMSALQSLNQLTDLEREKLFLVIFQHGWLIRKRLSLYSSLGNHTIAECIGLVIAGSLFMEDKHGKEWLELAIGLLEKESKHQILADGGPAEQSFSYHRFVLDLYWLAIDFLEINGLHDCSEIKMRVTAGERFYNKLNGVREVTPTFGDSDDGYALGRGVFPAIRSQYHPEEKPGAVETFPDSGYTVIRGAAKCRLIFDHGPLGMAPLYNHGHADALSIVLSVGKTDFLIDPGTYQYNGNQDFRRYFKSTRAHNTVTVDGLDQAEQVTGFIWDKPYTVTWCRKRTDNGEYVEASHTGYHRLPAPVTHSRRVTWEDASSFVIEDTFVGEGSHVFELHFHTHPEVELDLVEHGVVLKKDSKTVVLQIDGGDISILEGQESPLCGWFSPSYGVLQKTRTIRVVKEGNSRDISFLTRLHIGYE